LGQLLCEDGLTDVIDTHIGQDEAYSFVFDGQTGYSGSELCFSPFESLRNTFMKIN